MKNRKTFVTAVATAMMLTMLAPQAMAQSVQGAPTTAAKVDTKVSADNYLKQSAGQYGFKTDLSDLKHVSTIKTEFGSYVRYQQQVDGADVFYHQVTVTLDNQGTPVLVVSDYVPNLTGVKGKKPKLNENDAEGKALGHNKVKNTKELVSRVFGYYVEGNSAVPAYKVTAVDADSLTTWETFVDAETGNVLKNKDLNQKVDGTGKVFLPNPIQSAGTKTGFADNNDADSTALTNQLKTVTLRGLDGSGNLVGQYVKTVQKKATSYSATNTFNYTRSSDHFENVMVYYHIDELQRYIQSIGFTNVNNRQITVNVNGTTADNSFYSPSTKQLTFGTGGVDDAEDAGIIAHEYGHSIQDNQVPGFGNTLEGGAMGEGFGDYLGAIWEDKLAPGTYGKACIGEWDSTSYSTSNPPCLRRLDKNKVMPGSWYGEVHADGEIWSQGEYDMAQLLGVDNATKLILQSHFSLTPNSGFNAGAKAIKTADQLLNGGANASAITSIWAARGISTN
ncbi:Zn-dependent metalloprotease [Tumebacillus sp. BK434]|uniref:M36 family metallopeptidase n=1 Tax=Tumebacillus sp. BK434 TaxID=2512169 RepID=UPI0010DE0E19|nr:M36 family metallopeptidase [Tumebacillus sp. BK434]TCP59362.1 Zn-dependent metalloprotease [Tumebacillus sp. BK434]